MRSPASHTARTALALALPLRFALRCTLCDGCGVLTALVATSPPPHARRGGTGNVATAMVMLLKCLTNRQRKLPYYLAMGPFMLGSNRAVAVNARIADEGAAAGLASHNFANSLQNAHF